MTGLEIALIVVAVIFVLGSFMITEKLSPGEIDDLSRLSRDELSRIVENSYSDAKEKIGNRIEDELDESVETIRRRMEIESNDTIKQMDEYSKEVMESLHKTHTEVMFLYSMLEDKEEELKKSVSNAMVLLQKLNEKSEGFSADASAAAPSVEAANQARKSPVPDPEASDKVSFRQEARTQAKVMAENAPAHKPVPATVPDQSGQAEEPARERASREDILERHRLGLTVIDIARELGLGKGEVQLVIDLYEGDKR
ncbi:MAG: hypothetical protein K5840_04195 [Eubacterium sp.]|nr:hypothetical protein [Eubacterium sp.]